MEVPVVKLFTHFLQRSSANPHARSKKPQSLCRRPELETLEDRTAPAIIGSQYIPLIGPPAPTQDPSFITKNEVEVLLERAAAASSSNDGIIAVVDRGGHILGVRVESGVSPTITG